MTEGLTAERFAEFFEAVRGHEPFEWQADLAARLLQGEFPDVIDVPTGLGKTSVIDAWVYALAAAPQGQERRVPLRLSFVVDRRIVVDGAHEDACELSRVLPNDNGSPILSQVRDALMVLSGGEAPPLTTVRMRGGVTWESRWLARPDQPAVVVGTVDQFGSRLLFRGYGVSARMRPIDAALVGFDTWLVVDEAHIVEPLVCTVNRAAALQQTASEALATQRLRVTCMSATVQQKDARSVFRADPDQQMSSTAYPESARTASCRLTAEKDTALFDLEYLAKPGAKDWRKKSRELGRALALIAQSTDAGGKVVGVVANTISTARAAFDALSDAREQAILLIGRCREYEREEILHKWQARISVGGTRDFEGRCFVVATQTVEVGANLDFDALVSECAPLPSLIQRFGRVNRAGHHEARRSAIVHAGFTHVDDRIYGTATEATWQFLVDHAGEVESVRRERDLGNRWPDASADFGPLSASSMRVAGGDEVVPSPDFIPVALGAHFERWAATNPSPQPDQDVAPFLHGVAEAIPEVSVAWRADPPRPLESGAGEEAGDPDLGRWRTWLDLVTPVEWEFVAVPIWEAHALLVGESSDVPTTDLEWEATASTADVPQSSGSDLLGVVYRGRREPLKKVFGPRDIEPGDRLVLRSSVGGHDDWGWTGVRRMAAQKPVPDVAELAPTRRRRAWRIAHEVVTTWATELPSALADAFRDLRSDDLDGVRVALNTLVGTDELPERLRECFAEAVGSPVLSTGFAGSGDESEVLLAVARPQVDVGGAMDAITDDDEGSTSFNGVERTPLAAHGRSVGTAAYEFARHLGLASDLRNAVQLAGEVHDLGKADRRFQVMLYDGDELAAVGAPEPVAKSNRDPRDPIARRASRVAGIPPGFRHEAVSERLLEALLAVQPERGDGLDLDLVRHLVVSHHGWARPLLPAVLDSGSCPVDVTVDGERISVLPSVEQVDWAHPARFERLGAQYGWWGLAFLETIVRLADMHCSEHGK